MKTLRLDLIVKILATHTLLEISKPVLFCNDYTTSYLIPVMNQFILSSYILLKIVIFPVTLQLSILGEYRDQLVIKSKNENKKRINIWCKQNICQSSMSFITAHKTTLPLNFLLLVKCGGIYIMKIGQALLFFKRSHRE